MKRVLRECWFWISLPAVMARGLWIARKDTSKETFEDGLERPREIQQWFRGRPR
jgi:hypothetical protein